MTDSVVTRTYDLHSHTVCSDGQLSPTELIERAVQADVDVLSITDHDTVAAYDQLDGNPAAIELIPGIEFSTHWQGKGIHVLGLNIDPANAELRQGIAEQQAAREQRAVTIAGRLAARGIPDTLDAAELLAGDARVGRLHFAQHLVASGRCADINQAFKQYLGDSKIGDVRSCWAGLERVIQWISGAGGVAVLAHPLKYKLTRTRLRRLLNAFSELGGRGMEVVSGQQQPFETRDMGLLSREYGLLASCGSDFHLPGQRWAELGRFSPLPEVCEPVWNQFGT